MTKKTPMYNVTFKDIENYIQKGYEKGRKETIERASQLSMAVPIMVLEMNLVLVKKELINS